MTERRLLLHVENDVGVLAKVADLFAGKHYNLESLSVYPVADHTMSEMHIGFISDEQLYLQIKKQLRRCIGIVEIREEIC